MRIDNGANRQGIFAINRMQTGKKDKDDIAQGIQKQISSVEEQMKNLSENEDMSMEEKMDKRKELRQQITELNKQLSQRKMDVQKVEREEKAKKIQEAAEKSAPEKVEKDGMPKGQTIENMENFIAADTTLSQAGIQKSVRTKLKGQVGTLATEIGLDAARGVDTTKKEERLSDINLKIDDLASQMGKQLGKVSEEMEKDAVDSVKEKENEKINAEGDEGDQIANKTDLRKGNPAIDILL